MNTSKKLTFIVTSLSLLLTACGDVKEQTKGNVAELKGDEVAVAPFWPKLAFQVKTNDDVEEKVSAILATMTLEQKVAQMIQPEIRDITVEDMRKYGFGSYLNGGGSFPQGNKHATPQDWIKLAEAMYQASVDDSLDGSKIPTMWGTDAVHGHNNVIGATLFPHNIGLGAMNNPALIEQIAQATATEVMVTGIDWVFAPTVAVVRDDRWGRTYEGYSEDPDIVRDYAAAIVTGLQGSPDKDFLGDKRVISTVKHFLGDGGTEGGDDQGNNIASEADLFKLHAQGYVGGLTAGSQSVMASFNSWHGKKNHGNKYLLNDVLKERMGFDGFVVGDWNGHGQVKGCTNESCAQAVNAGLDIFMVPTDAWKPLYENTIQQVNNGEITMARIDDAVSRILRVKVRAGLFEKPSPANRPLSGKLELIGNAEHRAIARQAVRESLVLLKNKNNLLPLSPTSNILVTGDGGDNIGKQSGGWTITWQGTGNSNEEFPGGSSIYKGFADAVIAAGGNIQLSTDGTYQTKPDVAVVVFGEEPYAEGNGDIDNVEFQRGNKKSLALLKSLQAQNIPVVSVFITGRPLWVNAELNASDAFVAAWLPGSEGVGIADVLLKKADGTVNYDFTGKLSFSWPKSSMQVLINRHDLDYQPLLPYGFGLKYGDENVLADDLSEISDARAEQLANLVLFENDVKSPWRIELAQGDIREFVTSSQQTNGVVTINSFDNIVQEDARKLTFNGTRQGAVAITDNFPFDLRGYAEASASLAITLQIAKPPEGKVNLSMRCEEECNSEIDITDYLASIPVNEWQELTVDLACFSNNGATMDKIFAPVVISTDAPFVVNFTTVKIIPKPNQTNNDLKKATFSCQ